MCKQEKFVDFIRYPESIKNNNESQIPLRTKLGVCDIKLFR